MGELSDETLEAICSVIKKYTGETLDNLLKNMDKLMSDPNSYIGKEPLESENLERSEDQLTRYATPICNEFHFELKRLCLNCFTPLDLEGSNLKNKNTANNHLKKYCNEKCSAQYRHRMKKQCG